MDVATVQGNYIPVTRDVIERRSQQMWGRNGESVVKKLSFPVCLGQGKLGEINCGFTLTQCGWVKNTVGKPRHEHDLIFRRIGVTESVSQKFHSPPGG